MPSSPARLWPLYAGGFLGPFGGAMVGTMLPEVGDGLGVSAHAVAAALTAYMVPFAGLMLVSGTLAHRWGRARTVRTAYLLYAVASLACAAAPTLGLFFGGRAVQGAANAFTTPLLVSLIHDLVPEKRLGRALGTYASMQAAGQAFSPLVGGAAAGWDYRLAFVAVALAAGALLLATPVVAEEDSGQSGSRWRPLANLELGRACLLAMVGNLASTGLMLMVALLASDRFGLEPAARGLVVALFGLAGLALGRLVGRLPERFGWRAAGLMTVTVLGLATAPVGAAPALWLVAGLVALAGLSSVGVRVVANALALRSTPDNRSGAMSVMLSAQFTGSALAPILLLPVYGDSPALAFLLAGLSLVVGLGAIATSRSLRD
ncbi:MFS transporter [Actinomycetota bacterium]